MEINLSTLKIGDKFKTRQGKIVSVNRLDLLDVHAPFQANNRWYDAEGENIGGQTTIGLIERVCDNGLISPEVGKQYKTKDGRIATVTGLEYDGRKFTGNFVGDVPGFGQEIWDRDGVPTVGSKVTSLVALHEEPTTKTVFLNCDADGYVCAYDTREEADEEAAHDREACIEVTYAVGQGLEGESR